MNLSEQQNMNENNNKNDENESENESDENSSNLSDYEEMFGEYNFKNDDDDNVDNYDDDKDDEIDIDNNSDLTDESHKSSDYSMKGITSIMTAKLKLMKKLQKMHEKRSNVKQNDEKNDDDNNNSNNDDENELDEDELNKRKKLIEAKKRFVMASAMNNTSREYSHQKAQQHMYERLNKRKIQKNTKKTFRKTIPRTTNMKELLDLTDNNLQKGGTTKQAIELYSTLNNDEEIIKIKKELEKRLNANKERTRISLNEGEYQAKKRLEKRRKEIRKQYIENL